MMKGKSVKAVRSIKDLACPEGFVGENKVAGMAKAKVPTIM
jgi:hypothetical protein